MLIDLHSHILPGIDDGAKNIEETLALARQAVKEGITHSVVTPHHNDKDYYNPGERVLELVDQVQPILDREGIELQLYGAQEIHLSEDLIDQLYQGIFLSLDGGGKYYLLEFPTSRVPDYTQSLFQAFINRGSTPVIAHPERQHNFQEDFSELAKLVEMGCLGQVTSSSLIGFFGERVQELSFQMIEAGLIHLISSDAHNLEWRPFNMEKAYAELERRCGVSKVQEFKDTARAIINGDPVKRPPVRVEPGQGTPKRKKEKKGFWGRLFGG